MGSDNGVDALVLELMGAQPHGPWLHEHGYACELGAHDGTSGSNTLLLEKHGWTVLFIEPIPETSTIGRAVRKLWRNVACGAEDLDHQVFHVCDGCAPGSSLKLSSQHLAMGAVPRRDIYVSVRRLDRVLEEAGFPRLDYLSLDVEGYETEVLKGFDPERWQTQVMSVESIDDTFVTPRGFEKRVRLGFDNVYVRTE